MTNYVEVMTRHYPSEGINCSGDFTDYSSLSFVGTVRTQTELDALWLDCQKLVMHKNINKKTQQLLDSGSFTFEGKEFLLTDRAIIRWVGVSNADMKNLIGFPYTVTTKDYKSFSITSKSHWTSFFGSGLGAAETIEGGGRSLHESVNAATTQAELDAVVDNR